jgi:hypothetical protein
MLPAEITETGETPESTGQKEINYWELFHVSGSNYN